MSLLDAVKAAGPIPPSGKEKAAREARQRYADRLARHLAWEVAEGLRAAGFKGIKPKHGGPGEKEFQGGLGPKKVDVSYADDRHGLMLAISLKSITSEPYGKNLKNRFYDLCPEAISLHLRFPYSVVCALFCFPEAADRDVTRGRPVSTFQRARKLLATISGRQEYVDPGEKFENITMILFQPVTDDPLREPWLKLMDSITGAELSEAEYLDTVRQLYNRRNPLAAIGGDVFNLEEESAGEPGSGDE